MVTQVMRFADLKAQGIVNNRATLSRWIKRHGFPSGFLLGPNSRGWFAHDVENWLSDRPIGDDFQQGLSS